MSPPQRLPPSPLPHPLPHPRVPGEMPSRAQCLDALWARFGRVDHTGWCTHKSGLAAWNLFRRDFVEDKPSFVLETSV